VFRVLPSLWDGAVVPDVALVREAARHETNLSLLDVLKKTNDIKRTENCKKPVSSSAFFKDIKS
jgi:hypothetical protein